MEKERIEVRGITFELVARFEVQESTESIVEHSIYVPVRWFDIQDSWCPTRWLKNPENLRSIGYSTTSINSPYDCTGKTFVQFVDARYSNRVLDISRTISLDM